MTTNQMNRLNDLEKELTEAEEFAYYRRDADNFGYDIWNQIARLNKNIKSLIAIIQTETE